MTNVDDSALRYLPTHLRLNVGNPGTLWLSGCEQTRHVAMCSGRVMDRASPSQTCNARSRVLKLWDLSRVSRRQNLGESSPPARLLVVSPPRFPGGGGVGRGVVPQVDLRREWTVVAYQIGGLASLLASDVT